MLEKSLKAGFLGNAATTLKASRSFTMFSQGTEESIYTIVYYSHPEIFHEFKQERPEHPSEEALCLLNDRAFWIPAFKEKWIPD